MDNFLWEMEGGKPREHEHVPFIECFSETEDPDIMKNYANDNTDKHPLFIAYKSVIFVCNQVRVANNKEMQSKKRTRNTQSDKTPRHA